MESFDLPNGSLAIGTWLLIAATCISSFIGFRDPAFREKHLFSVPEILAGKQHHRLVTSAFLHADANHLLLNMVSIYLFGRNLELLFGTGQMLLLYFGSVIGGSLLSLWIHRQHEYRAYGASGGACGLIFSSIFLLPGGSIVMFPVPVPIPSWLYAILFLLGSFLALKRQADNIGHDAHLGGALIGLLIAFALHPGIVLLQPILLLAVTALSVLLFYYLVVNPLFLPLSVIWPVRRSSKSTSAKTKSEAAETDAILEKISRSGMESLTDREKQLLERISKKYQRRADSTKPESDLII